MKTILRITRSINNFADAVSDSTAAFHVRCLLKAVRRADQATDAAAQAEFDARSALTAACAATDAAAAHADAVSQAACIEAFALGFAPPL